jgi:hypothetical protein
MPHNKPAGDGANRSNRDELLWLETYFIVFPNKRRPTLAQVEHALAEAGPHLRLENLAADDDGMFASLLVESAEDHAAVEVSYETGDAVIEQNVQWAKQLQKQLTQKQLAHLVASDARLDVAHFERVQAGKPADGKSKAPAKPRIFDEDCDDEFESDDDLDAGFDDDFDVRDPDAELEIFDPTCLLTVVEALSSLTKGLTFDPASGEVM